jgi:hypothetical protein
MPRQAIRQRECRARAAHRYGSERDAFARVMAARVLPPTPYSSGLEVCVGLEAIRIDLWGTAPRVEPADQSSKVSTRDGGFAMQSFRAVVVAFVAGAAVPFVAASAYAQVGVPAGSTAAQCVLGCNMQKRACIQGGRVVALACKQDCRDTVPPNELGECKKTCAGTFRTTKAMCRADHKSCMTGCRGGVATVDSSCLGGCGTDLAECARGVTTAARTCVKECRSAPDRHTCLEGCATTAQTDAEACASDFELCGTNCPPPTP